MELLRSLAVLLLVCSCGAADDGPQPADAGGELELSFHDDVVPIFEAHCVLCHEGPNAQANLDLSRERAVLDLFAADALVGCFEDGEFMQKPIIVPGAPEQSALWIKVADTELSLECGREMPASGTALLESNPGAAETLRLWIAQGAAVDERD